MSWPRAKIVNYVDGFLADGRWPSADIASDVSIAKDLTAVIALQGMPCGEVMSATKQGENDYIAACKDGNRYRVFQNAEGRVIVEKK